MYQFNILRNHDEKFGNNRITFDPCPHIKFPLQIHVYACKWLTNIGIGMKFGINVYFVNLNHSRSIIAPTSKIGPFKEIC